MIVSGLVQFGLWLLGLFFKPRTAVEDARKAGATEVQKSELENALKKTVEADRVRDDVRRQPAGELRDDAGNLYRD